MSGLCIPRSLSFLFPMYIPTQFIPTLLLGTLCRRPKAPRRRRCHIAPGAVRPLPLGRGPNLLLCDEWSIAPIKFDGQSLGGGRWEPVCKCECMYPHSPTNPNSPSEPHNQRLLLSLLHCGTVGTDADVYDSEYKSGHDAAAHTSLNL